jgi:hypothetical protein
MQLPNLSQTPPRAAAIIFTVVLVAIAASVWALVLYQEAKPKAQLNALTGTPIPSPIAAASPVPHQIEAESSPFPSVLPSPTPKVSPSPSASASATPTPTPSPSASPTVSPSPSPSPPPDIDINLEEVVMAKDGTAINKSEPQAAGANYTVKSVTLRNNGHVNSSTITIKTYVQNDLKKTDTVDSLSAGTSVTKDIGLTLPNTSGSHSVKVVVNPDKTFGETRYDNNETSFTYTLN